jgi:hypothetical protein
MSRGAVSGVIVGGVLVGAFFAGGCSDACCTIDSYPINLLPAGATPEAGGLRAMAEYHDSVCVDHCDLAIDTGSPLTFFRVDAGHPARVEQRTFDILDPMVNLTGSFPVRALFRGIGVLPLPLDPAGPYAVLGGDFLRNYSVEFQFSTPSVTFWSREGASDAFLANAGFAVLHFDLLGGAELTATSSPDFLGLTGPVEMPATRVVLRGCGMPDAFDPATSVPPTCCKRGDDLTLSTGVDLALLVATGVGPLVLSQSAWNRLSATLPAPAPGAAMPIPGQSAPIPAATATTPGVLWSTLPRLALVDQESAEADNPGACVELGRARRLEWVEWAEGHQVEAPCVQPCDTDLRDGSLAQNAAGYIEISGAIPVAIVPDGTPLLQAVRAEIRPNGPELDGLVGAGLLAQTSLELDYKDQPGRALFSCGAPAADRSTATCWTSPRCPRLAQSGEARACFGQEPHGLPAVCKCG